MNSKTKIIVLHMKEIIYTVIFATLAIILILPFILYVSPETGIPQKYKKIYSREFTPLLLSL